MHSMGNRLKDLRKMMGWTQEQAAREIGVSTSGYIKLEHGARKLKSDQIDKIANVFGVAPGDVLDDNRTVPVMGYVGAGAEILPDLEQVPPEGIDQITLPLAVSDQMIAFRVRGISMMPRYEDGDVIIVRREQRKGTDAFIGREAVVRTADGRRFLKKIQRGERGYRLESWNDYPIDAVEIAWIGEIYITVPANQVIRDAKTA